MRLEVRGERAHPTQIPVRGREANQGPSCHEATVLTAAPPVSVAPMLNHLDDN